MPQPRTLVPIWSPQVIAYARDNGVTEFQAFFMLKNNLQLRNPDTLLVEIKQ